MAVECDFSANVNEQLAKAIDLALSGQWNEAHQMVQELEGPTAAWIHAVLHKTEGDQDNSRYWYRRAGRLEHVSDDAKQELAEIREELTNKR